MKVSIKSIDEMHVFYKMDNILAKILGHGTKGVPYYH